MQELDKFLAGIELRAFKMAQLAVKNEADALDIVQDAMMKLASNYAQRPANEWKPLFFRILENCINDFHRKETRRKNWFSWLKPSNEEEDAPLNPGDDMPDDDHEPQQVIETEQLSEDIVAVVEAMPVQQQQCFLLRTWEGMSVKETAAAMNITEGSVKTHYSRAMQKLQKVLYES